MTRDCNSLTIEDKYTVQREKSFCWNSKSLLFKMNFSGDKRAKMYKTKYL